MKYFDTKNAARLAAKSRKLRQLDKSAREQLKEYKYYTSNSVDEDQYEYDDSMFEKKIER